MTQTTPKLLQELIGRTALRDQKAFNYLYNLTAARLNGIALRILNDRDNANEVLQEAFVQIWNRADEYRADLAEPMTWMTSIVRYRAYDRVRFEKRRIEGQWIKTEGLDFVESKMNCAEPHTLACELSQKLEDCLATLEMAQQRAILMAYYYGCSREELSDHFQAPVNTVKSWLRRGLMRLQECLTK